MFFQVLAFLIMSWFIRMYDKTRKKGGSKVSESPLASKEVTAQPEPVSAPKPRESPRLATLPLRQFYWYYVSGIPGRFATLRDAISASGMTIPERLEWSSLSSDIRARINRVKVTDKQPVTEEQSESKVTPKNAARTLETDGDVIRKPIGKGAFVSYKKPH
jgi:hypothetical protein